MKKNLHNALGRMKTTTPTRTPAPLPGQETITYDALSARHVQRMQEDGDKPSTIRNACSALNRFLKTAGVSKHAAVGTEMAHLFADRLERYLETLQKQSSKNTARHLLNRWRRTYLDMQVDAGLPRDFAGALKRLMEAAKVSIRKAAAAIGSRQKTVNGWMNGRYWPTLRAMPKVVLLESVLKAPPGCLSGRLRKVRTKDKVSGGTRFRDKVIGLKKKPYALRPRDWPERLTSDFNDLVTFKTSPMLVGGIRRNKSWSVKRGKCPTAGMVKELLARFFGWLLLAPDAQDPALRGRGMRREDLSLALLTWPELAQGFIAFLRDRSGVNTHLSLKFLDLLYSLCRGGTGYFPQHVKYADYPIIAAMLPETEEFRGRHIRLKNKEHRWASWCNKSANEFHSNRRTLPDSAGNAQTVVNGRDPSEPIQAILALDRPMSALFDMIESMRGALPPASMCAKTRAVAFRDLLLVEMLASNPLRIGMFSFMTYRADQSGNLYRRQDGTWRLRFEAEDFKNARVRAARPRYDVPVHRNLWPLIEEYLREHRPHLMGADGCDYLFRPSPRFAKQICSKLPGPHAPMLPGTLSDIVRLASQIHIPECCGFGAHAIRHIVATHLIKTDPVGGWIRASFALNDAESTVRRAYAHLRVTEEHEIWLASYEQFRSAHESAQGEFAASCAEVLPVLRGFLDRGITDLRQVVADLAVRTDLRRKVA